MKWTHLQRALEEYDMYILKATQDNMPQYYELKDKISFTVDISGNLFEISFHAPEYWKYANYGRRPGKMPPISAIESWITRRRITPRATASGIIPSKTSLAFLIAKKIGRDGTEGSHFLEKSLDEQKDYWFNVIADAIGNDIQLEINEWLSPLRGETVI